MESGRYLCYLIKDTIGIINIDFSVSGWKTGFSSFTLIRRNLLDSTTPLKVQRLHFYGFYADVSLLWRHCDVVECHIENLKSVFYSFSHALSYKIDYFF